MAAVRWSLMRSFLGLACFVGPLFFLENQALSAPKKFDVGIVFYQALGAENKLEQLFTKLKDTIERDAGLKVLPLAQTQAAIGKDLGLQQFGNDCRGEWICMQGAARQKLQTSKVLFLNVGVLGSAFLASLRVVDLEQDQVSPRSLEGKRFKGVDDFEKSLSKLVLELFPSKVRFVIEGTPQGASVQMNGRTVGSLPKVSLRLSSGPVQVEITHPGYLPYKKRVILMPNRIMSLRVTLEKKPAERRIVRRPPPPRPKAKPLHQEWWVWVLTVGVVGGVAAGVAIGVTQSQVYRVQTGL
ncbi:MAG: PEGA domain-containing protein [Myxococcales bacterium]|nr:PEGA domain-containing protein [Myxococcales bacterium]